MLNDISHKEDVEKLVFTFYNKVRSDELIGPLFNDVAKTNWDAHLPKMVEFWSTQILGTQTYKGQPFPPHIPLGLTKEHFERWLKLFLETVDENFKGQNANYTKQKAMNIANVFYFKIQALNGDVS